MTSLRSSTAVALAGLDPKGLGRTEALPGQDRPSHVYHFTDTARLPWILRSGRLRPGANRIGDFPDPDFLWATTDPVGDLTSSAERGPYYRSGKTRHVRFTFDVALFFSWSEVFQRYPQWTEQQVERLHRAAEGKSNPVRWWCSADPIPIARCTAIHTRSYADNRWLLFEPGTGVPMSVAQDNIWLAIQVAGTTFASRMYRSPSGLEGYEVRTTRA